MATAHIPTGILRSGETAPAATLAALKDKTAKTYYHMVPGASFIMPDGLRVEFRGGQFITTDLEIIGELDKVVNKNTSQIYTKEAAKEAQVAAAAKAAADAADNTPAA